MHDPRIGRFFAVDPLTASFPWYTPYQFSGNIVTHMIELEGLQTAPASNISVPSTAPELSALEEVMMEKAIAEAMEAPLKKPSTTSTSTSTQGSGIVSVGSGILKRVSLTLTMILTPTTMGTGDVMPQPMPAINYYTLEYNGTSYILSEYQLQKFHESIEKQVKIYEWSEDMGINKPLPSPEPQPVHLNEREKGDKVATRPEDMDDYVYRVMYKKDGYPKISSKDMAMTVGKELGARLDDVAYLRDNMGTLTPGPWQGGMSVQQTKIITQQHLADAVCNGKAELFRIRRSDLIKYGLIVDNDGLNHGSVQPSQTVTVEEYQQRLHNSAGSWEVVKQP